MSTMTYTQTATPIGTILLRPRPHTRGSGVLVLVPLLALPPHMSNPTLPPELWLRVLSFIFIAPPGTILPEERRARSALMRVSKTFKSFTHVLCASDSTWDSLRRIPYSTPGRWVHALDLSRVSCCTAAERLSVDTLLTQLFPITPLLTRLVLNSTVKLSRRTINALTSRESIGFLKVLKGIKWDGMPSYYYEPRDDPLLSLVQASEGLEELELFGPGLQDNEDGSAQTSHLSTPPPTPLPTLSLQNLHSLKLLSFPKSPLLESLIHSPLPSLRHLMVTPYDNVSCALTSHLVTAHGEKLLTLAFHTPKTWPPVRYTTPSDIFQVSPQLQALSLTQPLPTLTDPSSPHPIRVISIPRPDNAYLWKLEAWLHFGRLQSLEEVHMRETRWIRPGVSQRAAEAGIQGEMKEWKRRLARWRVRILDVDGREYAQ